MSLAIFTTLSAAGVFVATPEKGDRLMLTLWGILVSLAERMGGGRMAGGGLLAGVLWLGGGSRLQARHVLRRWAAQALPWPPAGCPAPSP